MSGVFCTENMRKKWSSTEQASDETVANKSWRYLFANPDRYQLLFKGIQFVFAFKSVMQEPETLEMEVRQLKEKIQDLERVSLE